MSVTININNLTLCHKGSNGISTATIPDVCNTPTPAGPVPIPYPNIAFSSDLAKGTTTVSADGGNMCAIYGSEFSKSTGDEPGTAGGITSGTFIKEATWITYSFDVKFEGQGACRLTDKMFHNHENTVNMAGLLQTWLDKYPILEEICEIICACAVSAFESNRGKEYDDCVKNELRRRDEEMDGKYTAKRQNAYDMNGDPKVIKNAKGTRPTGSPKRAAQVAGKGNVRIPDVSIVKDGSLWAQGENLLAIAEIKFTDNYTLAQREMDAGFKKAGVDVIGPLDPEECGCGELLEEEPQKAAKLGLDEGPVEEDLLGDALIGVAAAGVVIIGSVVVGAAEAVWAGLEAVGAWLAGEGATTTAGTAAF